MTPDLPVSTLKYILATNPEEFFELHGWKVEPRDDGYYWTTQHPADPHKCVKFLNKWGFAPRKGQIIGEGIHFAFVTLEHRWAGGKLRADGSGSGTYVTLPKSSGNRH